MRSVGVSEYTASFNWHGICKVQLVSSLPRGTLMIHMLDGGVSLFKGGKNCIADQRCLASNLPAGFQI